MALRTFASRTFAARTFGAQTWNAKGATPVPSSKRTFANRTFAPRTYNSGTWTGYGTDVEPEPETPTSGGGAGWWELKGVLPPREYYHIAKGRFVANRIKVRAAGTVNVPRQVAVPKITPVKRRQKPALLPAITAKVHFQAAGVTLSAIGKTIHRLRLQEELFVLGLPVDDKG